MKILSIILMSFSLTIYAADDCCPSEVQNIVAKTNPIPTEHDHEGEKDRDHTKAGADSCGSEVGGSAISPLALKNMGVALTPVQFSQSIVYSRIPAVVKSRPQNHQGLFAPWSGRVLKIEAELGQKAIPGRQLVTILRDPLPRVKMEMTGDILKLASEEYHNAMADLKKADALLNIQLQEQQRLSKFDNKSGTSIIPRKDLINLKYEILKAEQDVKNLEQKLLLHGFTDKEISAIKKGDFIQNSKKFWINSLRANGLWNGKAQALFSVLPKAVQQRSWTIPSIAELAAQDYLSDDIIELIGREAIISKNFLDAAGLISVGYSAAQLKDLAERGVFSKVISLQVKESFDVANIYVRRGQKIESGQELLMLRNPTEMYFEAQAQGSEKGELKKALQKQWLIQAEALTDNSIEKYTQLQVSHLVENDRDATLKALVPVTNRLVRENSKGGAIYRSWELQDGLRFFLLTPKNKFANSVSVPAGAILTVGAEKIVLVEHGNSFVERKVRVLYQDGLRAILGSESELKSGEKIVTAAAFELYMALQQGNQENVIDPHAGCNHG